MVAEMPEVRLPVDCFEAAFPACIDGPRACGRRRRRRRRSGFLAGVATGHVVLERRRLDGGVLAERTAVWPVRMDAMEVQYNAGKYSVNHS